MTTRDLFRKAAQWVQEHSIQDLDARPAFIYQAQPEPPQLSIPRVSPKARQAVGIPTVVGTARAIREGSLTSQDAVVFSLNRIAALNGKLRAFVIVRERGALNEAEQLDSECRAGVFRGPLHGVPVSVKDVIHVAGLPTTASSRVLDDFVPREDACAVARASPAG